MLAHESRRVAQEESARQTTLLLREIEAHSRTDAALQKAKEVAEAANLAKSRYLVGLSHELRTPLNSVFGYTQILERDAAIPPEQKGRIHVIRRSAEHLSGLIDGLLEISKIETGRLQLQRNEIHLDEFLADIVEMFRPQAEAKGLAFHYIRPETMPEIVSTDGKRLRQILVNLFSNAIKFTESGHVALKISFRSQVATLTIEDTGVGIAAEDLPKIFEPFERGTAERTRLVPGTGLGLTIVKMLVSLMGGDVAVRSEPGKGKHLRHPPDALRRHPAAPVGGAQPAHHRLCRRTPLGARRRRRSRPARPHPPDPRAARLHGACGRTTAPSAWRSPPSSSPTSSSSTSPCPASTAGTWRGCCASAARPAPS